MSDLDLAIDLAPAAAATTVEALTELGLQPRLPVDAREFADPAVREGWIRDPGGLCGGPDPLKRRWSAGIRMPPISTRSVTSRRTGGGDG